MLSYEICNQCRLSHWPDTCILDNSEDWWPCPVDMVHRTGKSEIPSVCVRKFEQSVFNASRGDTDEK